MEDIFFEFTVLKFNELNPGSICQGVISMNRFHYILMDCPWILYLFGKRIIPHKRHFQNISKIEIGFCNVFLKPRIPSLFVISSNEMSVSKLMKHKIILWFSWAKFCNINMKPSYCLFQLYMYYSTCIMFMTWSNIEVHYICI